MLKHALVVSALAASSVFITRAATLPTPVARAVGQGWWIEDVAVRGACGGGPESVASMAVYLPRGYGTTPRIDWRLAIALHGWDHGPQQWRSTNVAALADEHQVVVAFPRMGRTVYEARLYPGSIGSPSSSPGACWIGQVVLPWLRDHLAVSRKRERTAVIGYSTGGRGALVVASRYPEFGFVASMSGTYDLTALAETSGEYRIHEAVFGSRARYERRWREENVVGLAALRDAPAMDVWLAHGARDAVVPADQLARVRAFLAGTHHHVHAVLDPAAAHDFAFWRAQLPAAFEAMRRSGDR
jgi:S-formylglutathione hydrolase FrmB